MVYQHFVLATDVVNIDATFPRAVLMLRMIARDEGRLRKEATDPFTPPYFFKISSITNDNARLNVSRKILYFTSCSITDQMNTPITSTMDWNPGTITIYSEFQSIVWSGFRSNNETQLDVWKQSLMWRTRTIRKRIIEMVSPSRKHIYCREGKHNQSRQEFLRNYDHEQRRT